jgi:hypothetical protein
VQLQVCACLCLCVRACESPFCNLFFIFSPSEHRVADAGVRCVRACESPFCNFFLKKWLPLKGQYFFSKKMQVCGACERVRVHFAFFFRY